MSYSYEEEKHNLFTESGIAMLFKIRDNVRRMGNACGAFTVEAALNGVTGDSFTMLAAIDFLTEKGEIKKVYSNGPTQKHIYVLV